MDKLEFILFNNQKQVVEKLIIFYFLFFHDSTYKSGDKCQPIYSLTNWRLRRNHTPTFSFLLHALSGFDEAGKELLICSGSECNSRGLCIPDSDLFFSNTG